MKFFIGLVTSFAVTFNSQVFAQENEWGIPLRGLVNRKNDVGHSLRRSLEEENGNGDGYTLDQGGIVPTGNIGGTTGRTASLFEGDLMLTYDEAVEQFGTEFAESLAAEGFIFLNLGQGPTDGPGRAVRQLAATRNRRWPNRDADGVVAIAYTWDSTIPASDTTRRTAARDAMDYVEQSGVVRFVERTSESEYFEIGVFNATRCYVARTGYDSSISAPQNLLNLGWCNSTQDDLIVIVHELLHILGFYHEHARPDRDSFITLNVATTNNNWVKRPASVIDSLGSDYDYASIMHYYSGAFKVTFTIDKPVPACLTNAGIPVGETTYGTQASAEDIDQLRLLYQCAAGSRTGPVPQDDYCTSDCPCWEECLGDCDSDEECQGDLICGAPRDPGAEGWLCEDATRTLPTNMCLTNTLPVAVCQDAVRSVDDTCQYEVTLDDVNNGSHDADGHVVDPVVQITTSPTTLSPGTHSVVVEITDSAGASDSCTATVEVVDDSLPEIQCPDDIVADSDPGVCGAVVDYTAPEGTGNCPSSASLTAGLGPGATFPVGATTETYVVTNDVGNSATCSFLVTVMDIEPPVASCAPGPDPDGNIPPANNQHGFWTVSATDNCGVTSFIVRDSGSDFVFPGPFDPLGTDIEYIVGKGSTSKSKKQGQEDGTTLQCKTPKSTKGQGQVEGCGEVEFKLTGKGAGEVVATDGEGNEHSVLCAV